MFSDPETLSVTVARVLAAVRSSVWVVTADSSLADTLCPALRCYQEILGDERPLVHVPEVTGPRNTWIPENEAARCAALDAALHPAPALFVLSALSLLSPAPAPGDFREKVFRLRVGDTGWDPERLATRLLGLDYDNEFEVHVPGEFARRGGILDLYSPVHDAPVRVEFFGDEVESMRFFDPDTQRSFGEVADIRVIPRGQTTVAPVPENARRLLDYAPDDSPLVLCEPERIREHLETFGDPTAAAAWEQGAGNRWRYLLEALALDDPPVGGEPDLRRVRMDYVGLGDVLGMLLSELGPSAAQWHWQQLRDHLRRWGQLGRRVVACCASSGELGRFQERLAEDAELRDLPIVCEVLPLEHGVFLPGTNLVMLSSRELFGRQSEGRRRRRTTHYRADHAVHEGMEIEEGEHAVHASHGVCLFRRIRQLEFDGQIQEVIELEFAEDGRLYVPLDQAHLVSRYVGGTRKLPKLSRLGSGVWQNTMAAAEAAASDVAADLLRLEASRQGSHGFRQTPDPSWEQGFGDAFPYSETEDQRVAIRDVLHDMERPQPMDRLLCGDVGYGKTEVAMRAAFRAVLNERQTAVLVPTTVLAQQHYITFRERMAEYPVTIEMLSRFRTTAEQSAILRDLADGRIDIVIGTHRLLGRDVVFSNLGLVIIDEEQRFGVRHKEKLKHLRANVDVLTMTATPIPRTLYFSLSGLRHLSTIMTPPRDRLPVTTVVAQYDEGLIRDAILRELERQGQVYFLYNRVQTIERVFQRLQELVPEARLAVGHGQLPTHDLEDVMKRFILREVDVLVCTTIIESGLDIPNANTIIIDRADRFGLADLYQLRGRVGRYHHQAYAYLLLPPMGALPANARDRLTAIRRYTHLGAGFKLALRDLEIRGSGNIIGTQQSGHIAAVGFELYCQLLRDAAARMEQRARSQKRVVPVHLDFLIQGLRGSKGKIAAGVPPEYVGAEAVRVDLYQRLSAIRALDDVDVFETELTDRFGPPPTETQRTLAIARVRATAGRAGIRSVTVRDRKVLLETDEGLVKDETRRIPRLRARTPDDQLAELHATMVRLTARGQAGPAATSAVA